MARHSRTSARVLLLAPPGEKLALHDWVPARVLYKPISTEVLVHEAVAELAEGS
jgi:hypothetical protein